VTRSIRIYQPGFYEPHHLVLLDEAAAHHVAVVLRLKVGAKLTLFDGQQHEYQALIKQIHKKQVWVQIVHQQWMTRESPYQLHLWQSLAKNERMEWLIQKAVELGVMSITPVLTEHYAQKMDKTRLDKKCQQWRAIVVSACEQCGRTIIPEVKPVITFKALLADAPKGLNIALLPQAKTSLLDLPRHYDSTHVLIGPEGGFSQVEQLSLHEAGFLAVQLGPRILRTETAAIAALSVLQAQYGDLTVSHL
tara:strand:+ start:419 stop:1165 length:747 start_codon:yes stop_codon:yes gene_type:complete